MDWYYAEGGQQFGPLGDEDFAQVVRQGRVTATTLVWHVGMADWRPYQEVRAADISAAGQGAGALAAGEFCSQCGRHADRDDMIRYEQYWVCPDCKDSFFQRVREGVPLAVPQPRFRFAGFWIRFVAALLDGLIVGFPLGFVLVAVLFATVDHSRVNLDNTVDPLGIGSTGMLLIQLVVIVIDVAYTTLMHGRYAATLGKMICGLRITMVAGERVTYLRAFTRSLVETGFNRIPYYIGLINYVVAAFDSEKRALHDHICNTRVVYKK